MINDTNNSILIFVNINDNHWVNEYYNENNASSIIPNFTLSKSKAFLENKINEEKTLLVEN
jgi:hypothetical protein